jgi:cytochrome c oxidase subunit II
MGDSGTFWLPEQASTIASQVDGLFYFVTWVSTILFVGVVAAMLYFAYRYRRKHPSERPTPVKESKLLEISWIVVPTILVLLVFNWGFKTFITMNVPPPDAYEIRAEAKKWSWLFTYPNGTQSDTLYVPEGQPVKMTMSSQDVIHSFFIPAFRVKHDVLPNRYSSVWFEATKTGTFDLFCTEYCGTGHSDMITHAKVVSQNEFDDWVESGGGAEDLPLPELGKRLYSQQGCQACHSIDGSNMVGPTWENLYGKTGHEMDDGTTVTVDENYLREAILEPGAKIVAGYQNVMPASYSNLSERQLTALIAYMKDLSDEEPPSGS